MLASRSEGSGASSAAYTWDGIGRLTSQSDVIGGTGANVAWNFTLNPASQIVSVARTETSDAYAYAGLAATSRAYTVNGLNQYSAVAGNPYTYDANGNLTGDGIITYTYDIENRLVKAVAGSVTTNVLYDPLGRLAQVDRGTGGTTTRFLYDGDALVSEFGSTNSMTARFVHGSNAAAADPLVWYTGTASNKKRWLHADHLGSIIGVTDSSGASFARNAYDEYGVPMSGNVGRFQYTGQAWIPELGMYYYKARFYSAMLGRFMQVDPIGYEDQVNLYAYVGNDPMNNGDPSGNGTQAFTDREFREKEDGLTTGSRLGSSVGSTVQYSGVLGQGGSFGGGGAGGSWTQQGDPPGGTRAQRDYEQVEAIRGAYKDNTGSEAPSHRGGLSEEGYRLINAKPKPGSSADTKRDKYHNVPNYVRNIVAIYGIHKMVKGNDGRTYQHSTMTGVWDKRPGTYRFIVDDRGRLTHRLFLPSRGTGGGGW